MRSTPLFFYVFGLENVPVIFKERTERLEDDRAFLFNFMLLHSSHISEATMTNYPTNPNNHENKNNKKKERGCVYERINSNKKYTRCVEVEV